EGSCPPRPWPCRWHRRAAGGARNASVESETCSFSPLGRRDAAIALVDPHAFGGDVVDDAGGDVVGGGCRLGHGLVVEDRADAADIGLHDRAVVLIEEDSLADDDAAITARIGRAMLRTPLSDET